MSMYPYFLILLFIINTTISKGDICINNKIINSTKQPPMKDTTKNTSDTITLFFQRDSLTIPLNLIKITSQRKDEKWLSFKLLLHATSPNYKELERLSFFHNIHENRLDPIRKGFNSTNLPVNIELKLSENALNLLPSSEDKLFEYFEELSNNHALLQEKLWKLLRVWIEIPLDASIGGGFLKSGYRTKFSAPVNRIDALKRQGAVSKAIVTALIENYIPVVFNDNSNKFEMQLQAGRDQYDVTLQPDNEEHAISMKLTLLNVPIEEPLEVVEQRIKKANQQISLGEFRIENQQLTYVHLMKVEAALINHQWVYELLMSGITLTNHHKSVLFKL